MPPAAGLFDCCTVTITVTVTVTVNITVTVTVTSDLDFVQKFTQTWFSGENFTQKSMNYEKCPIETKQQKI